MAGEVISRVLTLAVGMVRRRMHDPRTRSVRPPRVRVDILDADEDRGSPHVFGLHGDERAVAVDELHAVLRDSQAHLEGERRGEPVGRGEDVPGTAAPE
jgi:hypothetical protein